MSKVLSREEYFTYYYSNGKTIDQITKPKNPLNKTQLNSKYADYLKKLERSFGKGQTHKRGSNDGDWAFVVEEVKERDHNTCQLIDKLPKEERNKIFKNSFGLHKVLDPAHSPWTRVGSNPEYTYLTEGIVLLNRYSHTMLDTYCSPLDGKYIGREEAEAWWRFIFGKELLEKLSEKIGDFS